ncbi:hypothetical protein FSP39_023479 [Pinctada imbricata]|uniref:Nuclear receptor coactivator 4 N-terminal domain-containing protein n=1 Tax=Pinctada imbricata TaxID=66713 RepID=A0AA88Y9B6_PINIB|nr:hypothetical protein FSP39_023479 [Pinctada imbricata]
MDDLASQIENTIKDIDSVKRQLQQNSSEVKSQIQTNVSRHMEALRNREVWLLNQVEVLQSAKEEVLHEQQARLNKQLGLLQSKLAGSMQALKLDTGDLKPEESPYVTFRSDSAKLREVINGYGKVDVNGLPHAVFVQPGDPATSLPRHFEEYEDADHHVLYKTVEEVKRSQANNYCVEISMPKLSPRKEDWLAHPSTTTASSESAPKFSIPAFNEPSMWLKPAGSFTSSLRASPMVSTGSICSTTSSSVSTIMSEGLSSLSLSSSHSVPSFKPYSTSASTQSWLKQIKHDFEDEDDFEIVDKVGSVG